MSSQAIELWVLLRSSNNDQERSNQMDQDEHHQLPDPPDLENCLDSKLWMENLQDRIDDELIHSEAESRQIHIESMLLDV